MHSNMNYTYSYTFKYTHIYIYTYTHIQCNMISPMFATTVPWCYRINHHHHHLCTFMNQGHSRLSIPSSIWCVFPVSLWRIRMEIVLRSTAFAAPRGFIIGMAVRALPISHRNKHCVTPRSWTSRERTHSIMATSKWTLPRQSWPHYMSLPLTISERIQTRPS